MTTKTKAAKEFRLISDSSGAFSDERQWNNIYRRLCGGGNGTLLQYSYLENPMHRGAWWARGVARSRTRLSNFTFTFHFPALEKDMATHSGILAWRIPGTGKPGVLPSMGSHRVGHDWSDLAAAAAAAAECYGGKSVTQPRCHSHVRPVPKYSQEWSYSRTLPGKFPENITQPIRIKIITIV